MTKEEALHFLNVNDVEEVEEAFEDVLFEYRNFFISKVPFTKLFKAKLVKLSRFFEAKEILIPTENGPIVDLNVELDDIGKCNGVKEVFSLFGENEMKIKLAMTKSETFDQFSSCVQMLLDNYKKNADYWKLGRIDSPGFEQVKMSVEPDVMSVYEEIKRFHSLGLSTSVEINQLADDNLLKQEAFRLSLWSKFEENV